jgi:TonB-dependent receptor
MKTNADKRSALRSTLWKLSPVATGCTVLLLASTAALAQQAATLDTVVVTGIRKGIEDAISVKKNADAIVESVSAEDIGKLPDISIAESIGRLPGLSAQRVAGRAQVISVRGLSPDFATTLLNGRELVSTGDNRSVEFDQYPSELLSGVTVYKTPDAALVGQGLSGTIDMLTVRPLNFSNRVVSLNARGQRNSLGGAANASANGNRFSASYIDQSADRKIGFAIGFAHQETPMQEDQVGLYEPWKVEGRPGVQAGSYVMDGIKALRRTGKTERDGVMATVEFRPSKGWTSVVDGFFSKAKQVDTANQFEVNLQYNGNYPCNPACTWTQSNTNSNSTHTGGTITNVYPLVRGMYNKREDEISAAGWNNKFSFDNGVTVVADVNFSKAKREELILENNAQLSPVGGVPFDTIKLNFNGSGFSTMVPTLSYADPSKLFLRGTIYGSGYGKVPKVDDELSGFKLTGNIPLDGALGGLISDIDVGLNYADRSKKKRQPEGGINVGAQGDTTIASDLQYGLVDLGFAGVGMIPAWNVPAAVARYMTFNPTDTESYLVSKAWNVEEKTTTAFLRANLDSSFAGVPMRGNFGLQMVRVEQSSSANYWDGTAPAGSQLKPIRDGKTLTDVLPSLNLAFSLSDDQTLRLGMARQMARPRVDQLRSALDFGVDTATGKPGASGGNAQLDPWIANAFDVSYEKYFGSKAYVAAAAFYKDLKSYIYTQSNQNYDFSKFVAGYVPPSNCGGGTQQCPPVLSSGTYTAPYNGQGGKLKGVELSASLPLNLVSPVLNGFGIVASASFNSSNIKVKDPESVNSVGGDFITLPGLSKRVYNLTAYYERDGFEARISQRKRSDFIGEIGNFNGARTLRYVVGESIVDLQLGYNFNQGMFKGLGLVFQVNNLGDDAYRTYAATKDRPLEYMKWGRTYMFGANYKF